MREHHSLCVHAHFYQPPRENPYTNQVPAEPGASPFSNWNERILQTCYLPNAQAGNFEKIGFNIGPTLTKWLAETAPDVLEMIIAADRRNYERFGAGNAIAQPYNHTILPLASRRDKRTQVIWGIRDFELRFGRRPVGMWLPETAVDNETLEILVEQDIRFTILAPWQVESMEPDECVYQVQLPGGRSIVVFVYNGGLSSKVSFDVESTSNADTFAEKLVKPEFNQSKKDRLVMIATDGELYGHHQPFREKFLAHLLNGSIANMGIDFTFPELWLKDHPDLPVAKIKEFTSWSCHHGVERWRGECGCTANNSWKHPFRTALDLLAERIDYQFSESIEKFKIDPWIIRDEYIDVILEKIEFAYWINNEISEPLSKQDIDQLQLIFQAQHERQKMFTSCGWFFGDLDRIELKNNLAYAAHAAWLMNQFNGNEIDAPILAHLDLANEGNSGRSAKKTFLEAMEKFSENR